MIFRAEKTRVVFGQVLLLTSADLATHDESRAQLDGLWLDEARVWLVVSTASLTIDLDGARWALHTTVTSLEYGLIIAQACNRLIFGWLLNLLARALIEQMLLLRFALESAEVGRTIDDLSLLFALDGGVCLQITAWTLFH